MSYGYGNYNDYYNLALYMNTVDCKSDYMSFQDGVVLNGAIGSGLALTQYGGQKVANLFSKNKLSDFAKLRQQLEMRNAVRGNNLAETLRNSWRWNDLQKYGRKIPQARVLSPAEYAKLSSAKQLKVQRLGHQARHYKKARRLLEEAKTLKGAEQAKKIKEFKQAFADARLSAYKAKFTGNLRPTSLIGRSTNAIKTATGVRALNTGLKTVNAASPVLRTAGKFLKGKGAFAALSVAADYDKFIAANEVGGKKAMTKEIAKSTGVAVAEATGFFAGMKAGAAIGTAVGTVFPGVGNVVGGIAGAVIGGLLSWGAGKLAHKALGCDKSEAEKITTKNARLLALKAKYNSETRETLVKSAAQILADDTKKIQENLADPEAPQISSVVQKRYDNAVASLENIAENDPQLFEKLSQELERAENEQEQVSEDAEQITFAANHPPGGIEEWALPDSQNVTPLQATMNKFIERISGTSAVYQPVSPFRFDDGWQI